MEDPAKPLVISGKIGCLIKKKTLRKLMKKNETRKPLAERYTKTVIESTNGTDVDFFQRLTKVRGDVGLEAILVTLLCFFLLGLKTCNLQFGQDSYFTNKQQP